MGLRILFIGASRETVELNFGLASAIGRAIGVPHEEHDQFMLKMQIVGVFLGNGFAKEAMARFACLEVSWEHFAGIMSKPEFRMRHERVLLTGRVIKSLRDFI